MQGALGFGPPFVKQPKAGTSGVLGLGLKVSLQPLSCSMLQLTLITSRLETICYAIDCQHFNNEIPFAWLNMSIETYKVKL